MTVVHGEFRPVGAGRAVFTADEPVEGPIAWLDSPQAVIDFVATGATAETIVLARGGTTTFLTPALTAGVKGVVTLQGAPESHLGIVCREYGIPCVMGVQFEDGVRSSRGEVIPADGVRVRLDISEPAGRVLVEPGAPSAGARGEPTEEERALAAQMEQVAVLLEHFRGEPEVPHGKAGDATMRSRQATDALTLSDASLRRELDVAEVNDLLDYMGFNLWEVLSARSTEGESGLIPRQEYEAFGVVQLWQRGVGFYRRISDALGVDGVIDLGRTPRREVGTKLNQLHIWCAVLPPLFGRGLVLNLGLGEADDRSEDVAFITQFARRLYRGLWNDEGPMFASARDNRAPLLDDAWIERFAADAEPFADDAARRLHRRFNATTELTGFLLHFDNRVGLSDTGPYPLPDGGFMIVRDHFLHDPAYEWHDIAEGLPHCLTQAMVFHPDEPLDVRVLDIGTLFSEPSNYLRHLTGMAVYARDTWDTPVSDIRRVDRAEMEHILARCDTITTTLYERIAAMSTREKIMRGARVYSTDFVLPFARAAGLWDEFVAEHDFFALDELAERTYDPLVREGKAATIVPEQFLTATALRRIERIGDGPDPAEHRDAFDALHRLKLRGLVAEPEEDLGALAAAGLVVTSPAGAMLSEQGHRVHAALLATERAQLDRERLQRIYERFLAINGDFKAACARWHDVQDDAGERAALLAQLGELLDRVEPALRRSAEVVERFGGYAPRLRAAYERADAGDHEHVTSPRIDSLHTIWMELHEDYVQVLEIDREAEGSF